METNRALIKCKFCSHITRRKYNLLRHIKRAHNYEDMSPGECCYDKDERIHDTGNGSLQPKTWLGRAWSTKEDTYGNPSAWEETSHNREDGKHEPRSITEQEFRRIGAELRTTKCRILDELVDCLPDELKTRARCICSILKRLDFFFVNRHHELIYDGEKLNGSNIHVLIEEIMKCCPREIIQRNDISNAKNLKKRTLKTHAPRIIRRESETNESRNSKNLRPNLGIHPE